MFTYANKKLNQLTKKYGDIEDLRKFRKIYEHIKEDKKQIIKDYLTMPMAKQHQDFREDNIIVGKDGKQRLIDWGRAYGYNPFMYDIAPFLINNKEGYKYYIKNSVDCMGVHKSIIDRWLYTALANRFLGVRRYRLNIKHKQADTKEHLKNYLKYEYRTYRRLLD